MKITRVNLFDLIFDKGAQIPFFITALTNIKTSNVLYKNKDVIKKNNLTILLRYIPEYIDYETGISFSKIKLTKTVRYGYLMDLDGFKSVNEYIKFRFKRNSGQILKKKKRLESCLNITYQVFFGEIEKSNYDFIMSMLKTMLKRRFNQRNEVTHALGEWDDIYKRAYNFIINKKASLFVIYHNDTPIHITLNYHYSNILHNAIPSYDIDYEKFALGNIALYQEVLWCIENNYRFLDQAWGDLEYKRRWSNYIYKYKFEILYSKKSITSFICAYFEYYKINFKHYLVSKKYHLIIFKLLEIIGKREEQKPYNSVDKLIAYNYSTNNTEKTYSSEDLEQIDFNIDPVINKIVNDFLYLNIEHINDTSVYKVVPEENTYMIIGKETSKKIIIKYEKEDDLNIKI